MPGGQLDHTVGTDGFYEFGGRGNSNAPGRA